MIKEAWWFSLFEFRPSISETLLDLLLSLSCSVQQIDNNLITYWTWAIWKYLTFSISLPCTKALLKFFKWWWRYKNENSIKRASSHRPCTLNINIEDASLHNHTKIKAWQICNRRIYQYANAQFGPCVPLTSQSKTQVEFKLITTTSRSSFFASLSGFSSGSPHNIS